MYKGSVVVDVDVDDDAAASAALHLTHLHVIVFCSSCVSVSSNANDNGNDDTVTHLHISFHTVLVVLIVSRCVDYVEHNGHPGRLSALERSRPQRAQAGAMASSRTKILCG